MKIALPKRSYKKYPVLLYSDQALFLAQLNSRGTAWNTFQEVGLPTDIITNGDVRDAKKLVTVIQSLISKAKLKEQHVIVGLPEIKATTQSMELSTRSSDEMDQEVRTQAKSLVPFSLSDAYFDWRIEESDTEEDVVITFSAMPRSVIDRHIAVLRTAGLIPVVFETAALTLARLVPRSAPALTIAIESSGSHVMVVLLHNKSIKVSSVIQADGYAMAKITKLVTYYLRDLEGDAPSLGAIYLCGKNISQQFVDQIKKELKLTPIILSADIKNSPKNRAVELGLLSSLAQKNPALPNDTTTINLLPEGTVHDLEIERRHTARKTSSYIISGLLVVCIGICALTLVMLLNKTNELNQELDELASQQGSSLAYSVAKISLIESITSDNTLFLKTRDTLFSALPTNVFLKGVKYDVVSKSFILSGTAADRSSLLVYKSNLEEVEEISRVTVPLSSLEKQENITFRIVVDL